MEETPLENFGKFVSTSAKDSGMINENSKLAEDRIISHNVLTHGEKKSYTTWVDGAIFYFQAETILENFLKQRRRWINGSFFCFLYLIFSRPDLILKSALPFYRKFVIMFMFLLQILSYSLSIISPGIFGAALYLALLSLFQGEGRYYIMGVSIAYFLFFFTFIWVHHYKSYIKTLFCIMIIVNAAVVLVIIGGYIRQSIEWHFLPSELDKQILQYGILIMISIPFIMAIIALNFKSLALLFLGLIPYMLYLPTLVSTYTTYAMARVSDTTWGNRETIQTNLKGVELQNALNMQKELTIKSMIVLVIVTLTNASVQGILMYFAGMNIISNNENDWIVVGILSFIFLVPAIQIVLSIFYFIGKHITGLTFWQRFGWCGCYRSRVNVQK